MSSHGSHDEEEEKEPIILTSPRRLGKGLAILGITIAIGAGILLPFFDDMFSIPPPVTQLRVEEPTVPEEPVPAEPGVITIAMLEGSAVQGNPDYDPEVAEVPVGSSVVWHNEDTVPHTSTSGTGPEDPTSGQLFDTGIVNGGESSDPIGFEDVTEGDTIPYYCALHPYMTGELTVVAAVAAEEAAADDAQTVAPEDMADGLTINILEGSAVQGNPDYDPEVAEVPVGSSVVWHNEDTVPHTSTSGTGPEDPTSGQLFDTGIVNGGESSDPIGFEDVTEGDTIPYYCALHPYMTGELTVVAAVAAEEAADGAVQTETEQEEEGAAAPQTGTPGAGGGANETTITILEGSAVQGNPDYEPEELTVETGGQVLVANQDTVPHTVTSGTGPEDPTSGQLFDTGIVNGDESTTLSLAEVSPGEYDYYCMVHPYMTGRIIVE